MHIRYGLLVTALGCGSVEGQQTDAGSTDTALTDGPSAPRCNPNAPFGTPTKVDELNLATASDEGAYLSPDELTVYFGSTRSGTLGAADIFMATRASRDATFGNIMPVTGVNGTGYESYPMITDDGLALYAMIGAPPNYELAVATRTSTSTAFTSLAPVAALNSAQNEECGTVLPTALYFSTTRGGNYDLYRAPRTGANFGNPLPVNGTMINSAQIDSTPSVTPDELTMIFSSTRAGGAGGFDVWITKRASAADGFDSPTNVQTLNSAQDEWPTWISADGCVVMLGRGDVATTTTFDIYVAKRGM